MKIIDAHCHIYPEKIADKATNAIGVFYDIPMYTAGCAQRLKESGAKIHTDRFLVCSAATTPEQTYSINDFIAGQCKQNPSFFGLGTMHYQLPDIEDELDRLISLGLHGVKFHNDFQGYDLDDPQAIPMYKAMAKRDLPVLFHMGDAHRQHTTAKQLANVMRQVPDLKVIAAHFGGYQAWDQVKKGLPNSENLRFDTSSSLMFISKEQALDFIDHYGIDRFFFGTDFPMWEPEDELKRFLNLGLSEEENEMIFHRNFEDFFGI